MVMQKTDSIGLLMGHYDISRVCLTDYHEESLDKSKLIDNLQNKCRVVL